MNGMNGLESLSQFQRDCEALRSEADTTTTGIEVMLR